MKLPFPLFVPFGCTGYARVVYPYDVPMSISLGEVRAVLVYTPNMLWYRFYPIDYESYVRYVFGIAMKFGVPTYAVIPGDSMSSVINYGVKINQAIHKLGLRSDLVTFIIPAMEVLSKELYGNQYVALYAGFHARVMPGVNADCMYVDHCRLCGKSPRECVDGLKRFISWVWRKLPGKPRVHLLNVPRKFLDYAASLRQFIASADTDYFLRLRRAYPHVGKCLLFRAWLNGIEPPTKPITQYGVVKT